MSHEESGADALTTRETQIVGLIVEGRTNDEIAEELSLSPRTVHSHISSTFKKLDVTNRTQLAVFALQNGIIGEGRGGS